MAERCIHADEAAGRALGWLDPEEDARFEAHLAGCPTCAGDVATLTATVGAARAVGPLEPLPAGLQERTVRAVAMAAQEDAAVAGVTDEVSEAEELEPSPARERVSRRDRRDRHERRAWWSWRPQLAIGVGVLAACAALVGGVLIGRGMIADEPEGVQELVASLSTPGSPGERGTADVRMTGIGRVVTLRTDALPILPKGQFYEVWFVGPGDAPGSPNRISAGTFHPDPEGRSHVTLAAAVNPALYPVVSITREAGDGDPRPGPEVLRSAA